MFSRIKKGITFIWHFCWRDKRASKITTVATTGLVGLSLVLNVASPGIYHYVVEMLPNVLAGSGFILEGAASLIGSYGVFWGVKQVSRLIRTGALFVQTSEISKNMSLAISEKVFKQKMIQTENFSLDLTANFVEKAYDSVDAIVQRGTTNFIQNLMEITAIAGYLSYRFSPIFLIGIAATTSGYIYFTLAYMPSMIDKRKKYIGVYRESKEEIFDTLINVDGIKYFGKSEDSICSFEKSLIKRNAAYLDYAKKSFCVQTGQTAIVGVGIISLICHAIYAYQMYGTKELAKIISYLLQWGELFENFGTTLAQFDAAFRGVYDLMDIFEKLPILDDQPNAQHIKLSATDSLTLSFNHVTLASKERNLLSDINFTLKPNTVTALIGPSGAGKSSIAKLIMRLEDPTEGLIRIEQGNLFDIRNFKIDQWRSSIAYLTQGKDTIIFKKSLALNLSLANSEATQDEISEAIKLSGLENLINKLPQKENTIIGAGSATNLSGGERKLIALCRFLLCKNAPICVLDEPTSDLDPETALRILNSIHSFTKNKTVLIITHDIQYAAEFSDQVIMLNQGKIKAIGTHALLKSSCEDYRRVFEGNDKKIEDSVVRMMHQ